ncbi:kinesin motor domain-containing protein, partial [Paraphysoderma sedebokerense]
FTFDHIFGTDSSQHDVYTSCVQPLLAQLLEGFNATVLAYGQTGSGKTYTIGTHPYILTSNRSGGTPSNYVGQHEKDSNPEVKFSVSISYLEIYQEHIRDLLGASQNSNKERELSIREDKNGVITTTGLTEKVCHNAEEVLQLLARGSVNRTTHSTRLNNTSSRSHAVFTITLRQEIRDSGVANGSQIFIKTSKMRIVDLAGSERAKRTGNEGVRFKEGVKINSSLLALGNVISILGSQDPSHLDADSSKLNAADKHIPYRDSKLTRILQDSLGGNSKTVLIGCISPNESNYAESLNTLSYANRAKNIKNK